MKQLKTVLFFTLSMLFVETSWADIGANATSANCRATDIFFSGAESLGTTLKANYAGNNISLKWYNEGTQITGSSVTNASSCTYGNQMTLPNPTPTRSGYAFDGWTLEMARLYGFNVSLDATNRGYITEDETSSLNATSYGLTIPGTWGVTFSYGNVVGRSKCSETAPSPKQLGTIGNPDISTDGVYCWCQANGILDAAGVVIPANGPWVYAMTGDTYAKCAGGCASYCASLTEKKNEAGYGGASWRAILYGEVDPTSDGEGTCEYLGGLTHVSKGADKYGLTETNTWGASFKAGDVIGTATCASNGDTLTIGTSGTPTGHGRVCWGRALGYTPTGGTFKSTEDKTLWTFAFKFSDENDCLKHCTDDIGAYMETSGSLKPEAEKLRIGILRGVYTSTVPSVVSTLDVTINGLGYVAKPLNGGTDDTSGGYTASTYGLTMPGEWGMTLDASAGAIRGTSLCSTTAANDLVAGIPALNNDGVNCWCRVTGYIPTTGAAELISTSSWIEWKKHASNADCMSSCARICADFAKTGTSPRYALYEVIYPGDAAEAYGFISGDYYDPVSDNNTLGLTNPGTWATPFSYGTVYGEYRCSTTGFASSPMIGNPVETLGQYCWCRGTGYTPKDGSFIPADNTSWVGYQKYSDKTKCEAACAADCCSTTGKKADNRYLLFQGLWNGTSGSSEASSGGNGDGGESGLKSASAGTNGTGWKSKSGGGSVSSGGKPKLDLSENNTWGIEFDYGKVFGAALCGATKPSDWEKWLENIKEGTMTYPELYANSATSSVSEADSKSSVAYCWCRVTSYTPTSGSSEDLSSSPWVYTGSSYTGGGDDATKTAYANCQTNCASKCAEYTYGSADINSTYWRQGLYSVVVLKSGKGSGDSGTGTSKTK